MKKINKKIEKQISMNIGGDTPTICGIKLNRFLPGNYTGKEANSMLNLLGEKFGIDSELFNYGSLYHYVDYGVGVLHINYEYGCFDVVSYVSSWGTNIKGEPCFWGEQYNSPKENDIVIFSNYNRNNETTLVTTKDYTSKMILNNYFYKCLMACVNDVYEERNKRIAALKVADSMSKEVEEILSKRGW